MPPFLPLKGFTNLFQCVPQNFGDYRELILKGKMKVFPHLLIALIVESIFTCEMLYLICTTISRVDHARYEVPYAQELGTCIWGPCYNSTLYATWINVICAVGKNINPRVRFKIKAS